MASGAASGAGGGSKSRPSPLHLDVDKPGGGGGALAMRRRSILGPPSLFPAQRHAHHGGVGGVPGGAAGAAGDRPASADAAAGSRRSRGFDADEVAVAIADLDFYYGLGNVHHRVTAGTLSVICSESDRFFSVFFLLELAPLHVVSFVFHLCSSQAADPPLPEPHHRPLPRALHQQEGGLRPLQHLREHGYLEPVPGLQVSAETE